MGWLKNMIVRWLDIQPAAQQGIVIRQTMTHELNVARNWIWYRGDPEEIEQFAKKTAGKDASRASAGRFWAATPSCGYSIRKIHSGLPAMLVDKLSDLAVTDMGEIKVRDAEAQAVWGEIARENRLINIIEQGVTGALVTGDGAFKASVDTDISPYPILEFYSAERVDYTYKRGRLQAVNFYTDYEDKYRLYRLKEIYSAGSIRYELYNEDGKEVPLDTLPETAGLRPVTFAGGYIMAVPLRFWSSSRYEGRGRSVYDSKSDCFDALDETISQWTDALRAGRVQKYIPENLLPHDPNTGAVYPPDPFVNQYIAIPALFGEDADKHDKIDTVQPNIQYEALEATYINQLDMCLQGILSPSTIGIDVKKMDNAESQREKEKTTLYTRGRIIRVLTDVIPQIANVLLKTYDNLCHRPVREYACEVSFGEYASPSFDAVVETVGNAYLKGIISIEKCVEELYGDTVSDKLKAEEVQRIKAERGLQTVDETGGEW